MADRLPYPASPPSTIGVATGPSAPLSFAAFKNNTTDGIQASRRRSRRTRNSARPGSDASSPSSSLEEDRIWGAQRLRTSPSQPLIRRVDDNSPSHLHEHYRLGSVLGTGAFSIVRTALERRTGKFWACKIMRLPSDDKVVEAQAMRSESTYSTTRQEVSNEVAGMLAAGPHPNVLTLHECFEERGRIYLLTQISLGGDLLNSTVERGSLAEGDARDVMSQLLAAVKHLHNANVVHRDIKLENLVLSRRHDFANVKLCDFGLSHIGAPVGGDSALLDQAFGTPEYVAPEVVLRVGQNQRAATAGGASAHGRQPSDAPTMLTTGGYGAPVDVWACGVCLFMLLSGYPPFSAETASEVLKRVAAGDYNFHDPAWHLVSDDAKDLVRALLTFDPAARPSAEQALRHPWFVDDKTATPLAASGSASDRLAVSTAVSRPWKLPPIFSLGRQQTVHQHGKSLW